MKKGEVNSGSVLLDVYVIPRSSKDEVVGINDGMIKVRIASPPVKGKANERLKKFLADKIGISKDQIKIVSGERSKKKRILLLNISKHALETLLPYNEVGKQEVLKNIKSQ